MRKNAEKMRKNAGKCGEKKAMTRTELPVALHVVFQQHSFPVTRILVPGPKHTDGKFVFECTNNASLKKTNAQNIAGLQTWTRRVSGSFRRVRRGSRSVLNQTILNITIELSHKPHAPDVV